MTSDPISLAELLPSWQTGLQAQRLAPGTIRHYEMGVRLFLRWCDQTGTPPELTKPNVQGFLAELLAGGAQPTTARARWSALKRFSWWLCDEGIRENDELMGVPPPKIDSKLVHPLTDAELHDLIKVCNGKTFRDRRDEAVIRLLAVTGMRSGECCSLTLDDVDIPHGTATIVRSKTGRGRTVAFGPQTAVALDRYLRLRRTHRLAGTQEFWLGDRSRSFGRNALYRSIIYRAELAGIDNMHPHRLRHTAATRWLARGGSEGGLMSAAGWSSRSMLDRYVAASASARAADESRRLGLDDL